MNLRFESEEAKQARLSVWHDKFLWLPTVTAPGRVTWLETVARQAVYVPSGFCKNADGSFMDDYVAPNNSNDVFWCWKYKTKKDLGR